MKNLLKVIITISFFVSGLSAEKLDCKTGIECDNKAFAISEKLNVDGVKDKKNLIALEKKYIIKKYELYAEECSSGKNLESCSRIVEKYKDSKDIKDIELAIFYLEKGSKSGNLFDLGNYGTFLIAHNKIKEGIIALDKGCNLKHVYACQDLGDLFVNKDMDKAIKYYEKGCDLKYKYACSTLAEIYKEKDEKKSYAYLNKVCEISKDKYDCLEASDFLKSIKEKNDTSYLSLDCNEGSKCMEKYFSSKDNRYKKKALFLYKTDCIENKKGSACYQYAEYMNEYDYKNLKNGIDERFSYYEKGCEYNFNSSCYVGGLFLQAHSKDNPQYVSKFINILDKGCIPEKNNSCIELSKIYFIGDVIKANNYISETYLYKSCSYGKGDANSCKLIGYEKGAFDIFSKAHYLYEAGNKSEAMPLYEKSCDMRLNAGCFKLALKYVEIDLSKSISFFEKACDMYHKQSCEYAYKLNKKRSELERSIHYLSNYCDLSTKEECEKMKDFSIL